MLHRLTIRNYAIIDKLEISFSERMNIITGETGAGKSILIGALGLILGERADSKILYNEEEKCVVEADFYVGDYHLKSFFADYELDFEPHTIIRREINQSGKSRAFINDTPVTLDILKQLSEQLVNLHSQHETLDLIKGGFQLNVIDMLTKNQSVLSDFRIEFAAYKKGVKKLEGLEMTYKSSSSELDYLLFQLNELAEAKLQVEEQDTLETEQNTLANVEDIKRSLQNATQLLNYSEVAILPQLTEAQSQLKGVKNFSKEILALSERLQSVYEELKDIASEMENIQEGSALDPTRLEEVNNRLNTIYRLQKKHNLQNIEGLLQLQNQLEERIAFVDTNSSEIDKLKSKLQKDQSALLSTAHHIHTSREKVLREFQNNVTILLAKVGMPGASFKVEISLLDKSRLNENGLTEVRFLFSANKGFAPREIKDVASGGELSRLMLCVKSLVAGNRLLPTLIFDEIDSGISGEVALKVGEIMKQLSRNHQLISITHLPQIARTGDLHLNIYKESTGSRTYTRIRELKGEERIMEIAKMLSGDQPTEASIANARELVAG
ncbi:MAG: DNA repair protein RecN [Bacteroidetes bacterium]|nr:DNA repair protein RecN [Bacteroidota bacterium]